VTLIRYCERFVLRFKGIQRMTAFHVNRRSSCDFWMVLIRIVRCGVESLDFAQERELVDSRDLAIREKVKVAMLMLFFRSPLPSTSL
jgi:hypothetical protein